MNTSEKALQGVKVLTFEHALAGPMATMILAAYGAEVVRVETSTRLDWHRQAGPFVGNVSLPDRSACYLFVNAGKHGITVNLRKSDGLEVVRKLVRWADVVVENYAGGVMARMGLGYNDLKDIRPDIIMLSAGIYGQTGPFARVKGHGGPLTALTGLPQITGFPDQPPQFPGFALTDFTAPRASVLAIVAALDYRRRAGKGQYLDASQFESAVHILAPVIMEYNVNRREVRGIGNRCSYAAPHGVYPCLEGKWCAICVFTDQEWVAFCRTVGHSEWVDDSRFATLMARLRNEDDLDIMVGEWTAARTAGQVMGLMQESGIAAGVVQEGEDLENDPQLRARGFYWKLEHPQGIGAFTYSGMPVKLSRTAYEIRRAPMLGEGNEYVYSTILGMPDHEFVEKLAAGVFE